MSSTKYIIKGEFNSNGLIEKTDLIGAFFGQTEGLIGDDLEFSNLQKNGKIGRIDIQIKKNKNKSTGYFEIPTALTKTEVSLVAAAIESITKIGHTTGKIKIIEIRDERENKRKQILKRAEELLSNLKEELPESTNMTQNIDEKQKIKKIRKYGKKYWGTPNLYNKKEIILVEGRADVLNLMKHNIENVLSFNGTNFDKYILQFCKNKEVTLFLDDDQGGKKHLEALKNFLNIRYYTFAPNGKEVEELNLKEINKALKNKKSISKPKILQIFKK